MGPIRQANEITSDYRYRYSRYCLFWVVALGIPLALLLATAPSVGDSSVPLFIMFLYVGLPIGTGTAFVAFLGFVLGGIWSSIAESSTENFKLLERIKFTGLALLLLPLFSFCLYLGIDGIVGGEVHAFSKNAKHIINWRLQPGWFTANVLLWAAIGSGGFVHLFRKLRSVYAA
jgi:hypothetical protein